MERNLITNSKSSNTAITSFNKPIVSNTNNKKSWSSDRFREVDSKKRGVYVEKKSTPKTVPAPQVAQGTSDAPKPQRRPKRGQKIFLNSCLSILSKETTATQFPESDTLGPNKSRKITRKVVRETVDKGTQDLDAVYSASNSPKRNKSPFLLRRTNEQHRPPILKRRKPRFRSRALNENFNDTSNVVVIQPKKANQASSSVNSASISKTVMEGQQSSHKSILSAAKNKIEFKKEEPKLSFSTHPHDVTKPPSVESTNSKNVFESHDNPLKDNTFENEDAKALVKTESKSLKKVLCIPDDKPDKLDHEFKDTEEDAKVSDKTKSKPLKKVLRIIDDKPDKPDQDFRNTKSTVITESKKAKKVLRIEEPDTLVSDFNSKNKSLYNIFVDLIETTLDVPQSPEFEIDETVANKLKIDAVDKYDLNKMQNNRDNSQKLYYTKNVRNEAIDMGVNKKLEPIAMERYNFNTEGQNDRDRNSPQRLYYINNYIDDRVEVYRARPDSGSWNPPAARCKKSRYVRTHGSAYRTTIKSQSFRDSQKQKIQAAAKAESFVLPKPTIPKVKKPKKYDLLNIIKQELSSEPGYFEEPENLHQALLIIARNKRSNRRTIHFDNESKSSLEKRNNWTGRTNSLKRRKVISQSTRAYKKHKPKESFMDSIKSSMLPREFSMSVFPNQPLIKGGCRNQAKGAAAGYEINDASVHSIEVNAYDFEPDEHVRRLDLNNKSLIYAKVSGISLRAETVTSSENNLEECLKKCELSETSVNSTGTASTTISDLLLRDIYNMY